MWKNGFDFLFFRSGTKSEESVNPNIHITPVSLTTLSVLLSQQFPNCILSVFFSGEISLT